MNIQPYFQNTQKSGKSTDELGVIKTKSPIFPRIHTSSLLGHGHNFRLLAMIKINS